MVNEEYSHENEIDLSDSVLEQREFIVDSINWKGHYKRLRLEPGTRYLDVPLSACVTEGDQIFRSKAAVEVICKHGSVNILPSYTAIEKLYLGDLEIDVAIKEITQSEEYNAYQSLSDFHYRGNSLFGRTSRLIIRSFYPLFPKVLGYIELTSPLYMNKARATIVDAPFRHNGIGWSQWDKEAKRKYINVFVRVARCVVYPEFRGLGLGQMLLRHAASFARERWQLGGIKPLFLEISADMLKFVPFAAQAGMVHVGNTEGNLARVYKDMNYLLMKKEQVAGGQIVQETMGIVDKQLSRMRHTLDLVDSEGISLEALLEKLKSLTEDSALKDFALFHEIVSLPKPTYMLGLTPEAEAFLNDRIEIVNPPQRNPGIKVSVEKLATGIRLRDVAITFRSHVRRTKRTHVIQHAFNISPDSIRNRVLDHFNLDIEPGEIVLVLGPSGSGKTTLLNILASHGEIGSEDIEVTGEMSFPSNYALGVFQPIGSKKPLIELMAKNGNSVEDALQLMGIVGLSDAYVYLKRFDELSNGQQYRVMLAQLVAQKANVWLIDEFCTSLDPVTANVVADKLQRMARKLGITVIAAAPHCQYFLHSLNPDKVVNLTSAWDYAVVSGKDLMASVRSPRVADMQPQYLRIKAEFLGDIRVGKKRATIRKGKQRIRNGVLIFQNGNDHQIVNVTSVRYCHVKSLTDEDAVADGFANREELIEKLHEFYPDIRKNQFVTVINFDTMVIEPT
ncbi:GNAT family N-acetyltransferase [Kamptonema cortianum]|nr:GNAT family N-acetyltransferase [Oscillatoria laete-virens]MDK3157331.1 GNAT family N-acetyltransferase [Kamptonema cortianum]MDL5054911.1 GNAT family N-acetyltransferase [Oscillatoria laete-virens NRMC-F 0139]